MLNKFNSLVTVCLLVLSASCALAEESSYQRLAGSYKCDESISLPGVNVGDPDIEIANLKFSIKKSGKAQGSFNLSLNCDLSDPSTVCDKPTSFKATLSNLKLNNKKYTTTVKLTATLVAGISLKLNVKGVGSRNSFFRSASGSLIENGQPLTITCLN